MDTLKVNTSLLKAMTPLSDAEKGRLFEALLLYTETGEEPTEFRGNERFLWPTAMLAIALAEKRSEQNRANASNQKRITANVSEVEQIEPKKSERFTPPSIDDVKEYIKEKGYEGIDAEMFVNFYASKGWKVGNSPMKNWKACLATWNKRDKKTTPVVKTVTAQQYTQRDYSGEQDDAMLRMLRGAGLV